MKSKTSFRVHSLHSILVGFPIAFALGAIASDIVATTTGSPSWFQMGYRLGAATWVTGLFAAIPGIIDYFSAIPSKTAVKSVAAVHFVLNLSIVTLFAVAWLVKSSTGGPTPHWFAMTTEIVGGFLLGVSGWYGGELVYRHGVSFEENFQSEGTHPALNRWSA